MGTRNLFRAASGRVDGDAVSRLSGGGLLLVTAALNAYCMTATVAAAVAGAGLLALVFAPATAGRRAFRSISVQQLAAALGAVVALATVAAYAAALDLGPVGHRATPSAAGLVSACVELAGFGVLGRLACSGLRPGLPAAPARAVLASAALGLLVLAEAVGAPAAVAATSQPKPPTPAVLTAVPTRAVPGLGRFPLHDGPVVVAGRRTVEARPTVRATTKPSQKGKHPQRRQSSTR
jgi:hypothetical protein